MRLFFGVPISEEARARITELRRQLEPAAGKVSWVQPANCHFTLRFLGEVPEARVPQVAEAGDGIWAQVGSGRVALRGVGAFPSLRTVRVMWVGLTEGQETLAALERALSDALAAGPGVAREKRPFTAHLTIGRVREPRRNPELEAALARLADVDVGSFVVNQFVLFQSTLRPTGPIYGAVRTYEAR
jgi:RNA 2',3'-cyclic 3'-phosphodiesterase